VGIVLAPLFIRLSYRPQIELVNNGRVEEKNDTILLIIVPFLKKIMEQGRERISRGAGSRSKGDFFF